MRAPTGTRLLFCNVVGARIARPLSEFVQNFGFAHLPMFTIFHVRRVCPSQIRRKYSVGRRRLRHAPEGSDVQKEEEHRRRGCLLVLSNQFLPFATAVFENYNIIIGQKANAA